MRDDANVSEDDRVELSARKMHRVKHILESYGHAVTMIRENRVGYVVYEDDLQVIAEPFSETNTRGL
jgi:hypothetical protein